MFRRTLALLSLLTLFALPGCASDEHRAAEAAREPIPLAYPNMSKGSVLAWADWSAANIMTFDYNNYPQHVEFSSQWFTKDGLDSFSAAMQKSPLTDAVMNLKQTVSAHPRGKAVLVRAGAANGVYRWTVKVPLVVEHIGMASGTGGSEVMQLELDIERLPDQPKGIAIAHWQAMKKPTRQAHLALHGSKHT